jgi:hypothetical protein
MADFEQLYLAVLDLPTVNGIVPVDILTIPQPLGSAIRRLVRNKTVTAAMLAETIDVTPDEALRLANTLVAKGYLLVVDDDAGGEAHFRINYARVPKHNIPSEL